MAVGNSGNVLPTEKPKDTRADEGADRATYIALSHLAGPKQSHPQIPRRAD